MPDPRKCCILGVCCPPGGAEQRADLRTWLLDKLGLKNADGSIRAAVPYTENDVDSWLDELFKPPIEGLPSERLPGDGKNDHHLEQPLAMPSTVGGRQGDPDRIPDPLPKAPPPATDDGDKLKKKA